MAEKKKPKPGPSTGGSSTSRIKKPKGSQPLTLGVGGIRTSKVSKKQMAGTRKVVGAIVTTAIPVAKVVKVASGIPKAKQAKQIAATQAKYSKSIGAAKKTAKGKTKPNPYNKIKDEVTSINSRSRKHGLSKPNIIINNPNIRIPSTKKKNIRAHNASQNKPVQANNPKTAAAIKRKPRLSSNKDLRPLPQRGKRVTPAENKNRAADLAWDIAERRYYGSIETRASGYRGGPMIHPRGLKGKNLKKSRKIRKIAGWDK